MFHTEIGIDCETLFFPIGIKIFKENFFYWKLSIYFLCFYISISNRRRYAW